MPENEKGPAGLGLLNFNLVQTLEGSGSAAAHATARGRTPSSSVQGCIYSVWQAPPPIHCPSLNIESRRVDTQTKPLPTSTQLLAGSFNQLLGATTRMMDKHRITVTIEAVFLLYRLFIGAEQHIFLRECANQHQ